MLDTIVMSNCTLSLNDEQEICTALRGLRGSSAKQTALQLADFYGVSYSQICVVSKSVRPSRKQRTDKGKRKIDFFDNEAMRGIGELSINHKLGTELAVEVITANPDIFGEMPDVSIGTINRYKNQLGIGRKQLETLRRPYKEFEAEFPLQIFQFDISGVKERWMDIKTRRILRVPASEVNANHANRRSDRIPLWKMNGKDDCSRFTVYEYIAAPKANSVHYINYLRNTFAKIGLPYQIYTDNDSILTSKRIQRGADILDKMFAAIGGFKLIQHAPGNPQATGKIERGHQVVEAYEKLIGVKIEYGDVPTLDELQIFAANVCAKYNSRRHRTTGIEPRLRLRQTTAPKRIITTEQFDAAFLSRELTLLLQADVTVVIDGVKYQLPRDDQKPFVSLAALKGVKLTVFYLENADFLIVITPNGDEFTVAKIEAKIQIGRLDEPMPESASAANQRALKASAAERKTRLKAEGKKLVVPHFDTDFQAGNVSIFPQATEGGDVAVLDELTHNIRQIAEDSRRLDYYAALDNLQEREIITKPPFAADIVWLKSLFTETETITEADLDAALTTRNAQNTPQPKTDKPARHLRVA